MKSRILTIFIVFFSSFSFGQYQQYINMVTPYLNDSIRSGFFHFKTPNNFQPDNLYQLYRQSAPDLNNNMVLIDEHVDSLIGFTHYKYQQTFMGIPIEGAGCIEHYEPSGSLSFINAKVADSIKKSHEPALSKEEALKFLFEQIKNKEEVVYAWESEEWEDQIKLDAGNGNATWYPSLELIWAVDTMKNMGMIISGNRFTLAYKTSITFISPEYQTIIYYIDAHNGNILKQHSNEYHDGPAKVHGYGTKTIDSRWKGGLTQKYILQTNGGTRNINTKKGNGGPGPNGPWNLISEVKDDDDDWGYGDGVETSAHYGVSKSWDYFRQKFGRVGMGATGGEVRVKTNWDDPNARYEYVGYKSYITFGKNNSMSYGLEPSIIAHEYTHGITKHTSDLQYYSESGALNESFSDIFGVLIHAEMYDNGNTDWKIGNLVPQLNLIRSLASPNIYGQPHTYQGQYWYNGTADYGGVHTNSGVQNYWFYLLSEGGNGQNDNGDYYYIVQGIGKEKASRIAYKALTSILQNSSQYSDAREATITAAKLLFGKCSIEYQTTKNAWHAVGVGPLDDCSFTASVTNFNQDNIKIYPNPASSKLFIDLPFT